MVLTFEESDTEADLESSVSLDPLPIQDSQSSNLSSASSSLPDVIAASSSTKDVSPTPLSVADADADAPAPAVTPRPDADADESDKLPPARVKHIVENIAVLTNVKVSDAETNKIARKGKECTRLKSICGIPVRKIACESLSKFHSKWRVTPHSMKKKKALCDKIVKLYSDFLTGRVQVHKNGKLKVLEDPEAKRHQVNKMRFINILFCEIIRPKLATRGKALTKDELTGGIKQDEQLHRDIIVEYNKEGEHEIDCFRHVGMGPEQTPKLNGKPIVWEQSKVAMATIAKQYETVYRNWKKSGNHNDFVDYVGHSKYLLYLYEFDHMYPGFLDKLTGRLEDNVFRESVRTAEATVKAKAASKKRKRGPKKRADGDNDIAIMNQIRQDNMLMKERMYSNMANDSHINQRKELLETQAMLKTNIDKDTNEVKKLLEQAKEKLNVSMKETIKKYNERKAKSKPNKGIASLLDVGDDDDDDDDDGDDSGVGFIFDSIMKYQEEITRWEEYSNETIQELDRVKKMMEKNRDKDKENLPSNVLEIATL